MRTWRTIARVAGGSVGSVFTVVWTAVRFIQERQPMSALEWVGIVLVSASVAYGVAELEFFLRGLRRDVDALRAVKIESRLARMEGWWMDPNDLGLIAMRALGTEKK